MSRRLLLSIVAASLIAPGSLYALPRADEIKRDKASVDTTANRKGKSDQGSDADDNVRKKLKPRKGPALPPPATTPSVRPQVDDGERQIWDTEFFVRSLFPQNSDSLATLLAFAR